MGYRSEVGIKCQENAFNMFKKEIEENDFAPDNIYKNGCGEYTLSWTWVKWYEDYSEIIAITDIMDKLDEMYAENNDDTFGYHFIRIGEDYEDIEERFNDYGIEFYVTRTIDYDGDCITL